jgi:hypothetical protein
MKPFRLFGLLALLLTAACKKDAEPQPTKTDYLTGTTWKDSQTLLQLNTVVGTQTSSSPNTYQFSRDGKVIQTSSTSVVTTGTWQFASNETQLTLNMGSKPSTVELFELTKDRLNFGVRYGQTEIQQAFNGGGPNASIIQVLVLSAGSFTFPAGTNIPAAQLTNMQFSTLAVPR